MEASSATTGGYSPSLAVPVRICHNCEELIPANRLAIYPSAILCVPCLEASGDVAPLRRFDECVGDDSVETWFRAGDKRMERLTNRIAKTTPKASVLSDRTEAPVLIQPHQMRDHDQLSSDIISDFRSTLTDTWRDPSTQEERYQ